MFLPLSSFFLFLGVVTINGLPLPINLQGVTKGSAAEKVLSSMISNGKVPDFVLCIGDDRSDEDMFESILSYCSSLDAPPEIFDCTVGQKPSKARYYLDDVTDVHAIIESLGDESVFKLWR